MGLYACVCYEQYEWVCIHVLVNLDEYIVGLVSSFLNPGHCHVHKLTFILANSNLCSSSIHTYIRMYMTPIYGWCFGS